MEDRKGVMMKLQLKKVCPEDMDLLYAWANDPTVRQNAFHPEEIPYENHVRWFRNMMENRDIFQYIMIESETGKPVGQIRLNAEGKKAVISYSVAKEERGKGYGKRLLQLVEDVVKKEVECRKIKELVGLVKYENPASAKTFENCGYKKWVKEEFLEFRKNLS